MADTDLDVEDTTEDAPKPRNGLREQLEAVLAEKKQLETELNTLRGSLRERTVAEVLTAKGVNPKVAKYIPQDVEGEEAIVEWLKTEGDVFGVQFDTTGTETAPEPNKPAVNAGDVQATQRIQNLGASAATPALIQDIENRLAAANSQDEINAIWTEAQKYFL